MAEPAVVIPDFLTAALPVRAVFGSGTLSTLGDEIRRLHCRRALIISTPGHRAEAESLSKDIQPLVAGVFSDAAMHTPVDVTERALAYARQVNADCTVAMGGGSTIGLGKAIALRTALPQIAIPTTYAGSEVTPILGQTEGGHKTTLRDSAVLPTAVIYDVNLTLSLPPALSATSGLNAIAHAAEALYAQDRTPSIMRLAEEGIAGLGASLPIIMTWPRDELARTQALLGAWMCGVCLGTVGMSLHHKLCHTLGGSFGLPHSQTHAVMLPYSLAYNAPAAADAMTRIAGALKAPHAVAGIWSLARKLNAPANLAIIGMQEDSLDEAAQIAAANPYWNPRPVEKNAIRRLLHDAYRGNAPGTY